MGKWRWLRVAAEIAFILIPMAVGGIFLFFDLLGIAQLNPGGRHLNWPYLSLIAFGAVIIVALTDIGRLARRVLQLEDMQADLSVVFRDESPYVAEYGYYRIGVYNHGPAAAEGVDVMLQDVIPHPPRTHLAFNMLPSSLVHKDGYCQNTHCVLNPEAEHQYDVVRDVSPDGMKKGSIWGLQTKVFQDTWLQIDEERSCYCVLVVTARNARKKLTRYLQLCQEKGSGLTITLLEQAPDMEGLPTLDNQPAAKGY
jgi:hypothetical protein